MNSKKISTLLSDIKQDNTSGANELIDKALAIIRNQLNSYEVENADITKDIVTLSKEIIDSRPSMAPLINTIGYLIHDLSIMTKNNILERLNQFEVDKLERYDALEESFSKFLTSQEKEKSKILLISYSSTINKLLTINKHYPLELYILESRPLCEGHKVAELLSSYFKTNLIIDAAMGKFINNIDLVLIGVDSILKNGSIINKIGTFPLAVLADAKNIDVYAVADSFKYNLKSHYNQEIIIEEKPIEEIYDKNLTTDLLKVHNFYFDITPQNYITGIISDLGILSIKEFLEKVKKSLPIEWFKYFLNDKGL
ncbi:MAG: hypothetical protein ACFFB0_08675 [Promethearchaeota archaeon]